MKPLLPKSIKFNVKKLADGKEIIFKNRKIGQIYERHFKIKEIFHFNFKNVQIDSTYIILKFELIPISKQFIKAVVTKK